ncbi:hypothetical protein SKAU_G00283560 [Synaphobranchus kaupii]|uniref:Uncharacterized protein n=1 Tax=Synaphobranchus kaupii TaxID=118154 RepID=A0A9Q1EXL5_SYNKA|nr:hypothetical protein SKAU_G00283560 [Synaphobranchus kaupii]
MRGGAQRRARARVTDEIRATIIDYVINHGLSFREAGERVQPNLSRDTVASIVWILSPGQRGANITMCAAISNNGALLHKCEIGPYNTDRLLLFLEDLHERLVPEAERGQNHRRHQRNLVERCKTKDSTSPF